MTTNTDSGALTPQPLPDTDMCLLFQTDTDTTTDSFWSCDLSGDEGFDLKQRDTFDGFATVDEELTEERAAFLKLAFEQEESGACNPCPCDTECSCGRVVPFKPGKDPDRASNFKEAGLKLVDVHYTKLIEAAREKFNPQTTEHAGVEEALDQEQFAVLHERIEIYTPTEPVAPRKIIKGDPYAVMKFRLVQMRQRKLRRIAAKTGPDFWTTVRYRKNSLRMSSQRETTKALMRWFGERSNFKALAEESLERYKQTAEDNMIDTPVVWANTYFFNQRPVQAFGY
jgi:hypothetical protein